MAATAKISFLNRDALPVCPPWNLNRLASLWDIVNRFSASEILKRLSILEHLRHSLGNLAPSTVVDAAHAEDFLLRLQEAQQSCKAIGFSGAELKIRTILIHVQSLVGYPCRSLSVEVRHAIEAIQADFFKRIFLEVKPEQVSYIDNPLSLGETVRDAFPSAIPDIIQAGNCLAAECHTASVFHLMRTVEWGLRSLGAHLGVRNLKTNKKSRVKITPLPYSQWEQILDGLQARVDKKLQRLRPGPGKQEQQEFYYPALQDIRGIRDAWRNHLMHTRAEYTPLDAANILSHVDRLMKTLATRVSKNL